MGVVLRSDDRSYVLPSLRDYEIGGYEIGDYEIGDYEIGGGVAASSAAAEASSDGNRFQKF